MAAFTLDLRKHSGPIPDDKWHGPPNHQWMWKLRLTSTNEDSVPLISSSRLCDMQNLLSEKITLDLSSALQSFVSSPGEMLLKPFHVQEWLDTKTVAVLLLVHSFSTASFLSLGLSINVLNTELCEQPASLAMNLKVSLVIFLDNYQVSSLPHDCIAYRSRLKDHLKASQEFISWLECDTRSLQFLSFLK